MVNKIALNTIQPVAEKIFYLRRDKTIALLSGQGKEFARLQKEHAKICADNFELSKQVNFPLIKNIPVFSSLGFNIIKVSFMELFRPKTTSERIYRKMLKADKIKDAFFKYSKS